MTQVWVPLTLLSGGCWRTASNIFDPPFSKERQQRMEEGNILDLQERKDEERRKIREEKARLARHAAIQVGTGPGPGDTVCWH